MSGSFPSTRTPDVVILGAGLIGLAIALQLNERGARVTLVERGRSLEGASTAAAGMLAAEDPGNAPELQALSHFSIEHYPAFLARLHALSGIAVPYQTETTVQYVDGGSSVRLPEHSLDPRQLAAAVRAAVRATPIQLVEGAHIASLHEEPGGPRVQLADGPALHPQSVVVASGAWTSELTSTLGLDPLPVTPRKGQMLRVRLPFALKEVHRSEHIYVVPRTVGPQAGTALIGASVEDAGFDTSVHSDDLRVLRLLAAQLLPQLASETAAPLIDAWAGLRPATPDGLPMLGATAHPGLFVATGHYRNGILQAPGTAILLADVLEGKAPAVDLSALSPLRFALTRAS